MKACKLIFMVVTPVFFLVGCFSTPKGDTQGYDDLREGTIYRAYQKVSIKAMKPVVEEYNRKLSKQGKPQNGDTHIHALLGLIWVVASEPKYSLAEAEFALDSSRSPGDRYASLMIQSLAMHEHGWHHLAKLNTQTAKNLVSENEMKNRYNNIASLVHVAGSTMALKDGNIPFVASEVRALGESTSQSWLVELGDATNDAYSGARDKAIVKLEKIRSRSDISGAERAGIDRALQAARNGGDSMDKAVADAAVSVIYSTVIQKNPLTPMILNELPEKYRNKLIKHF